MATKDGFFSFGEHSYCTSSLPLTRLPSKCIDALKDFEQDEIATTVIAHNTTCIEEDDLECIYRSFEERDDVWSPNFTTLTIVLQPPNASFPLSSGGQRILNLSRSEVSLPQGPFIIKRSTGEVYAVYRLFADSHHAFFESILHKKVLSGELECRSRVAANKESISIPVPSRLYFPPGSSDKPLSGLRFAVKDTIDLKGFQTGYGSAAYRATYPRSKKHAPCVQTLLDAGAVVVGITKTTEFAEGTDPHEWIDTECPYNPRGDGQQKPSSSSTGSAVAIAAYDWLDFSLGTDTGGSIRHPAGINGIFGSRTTQGAIDLTGVLGATDLLNTVGVFARDATVFGIVGEQLLPQMYQPVVPFSQRKHKLLCPVRARKSEAPDPYRWFPHPADDHDMSESEKQMEGFVKNLESRLRCDRICFNIDELWQATRPKGQPNSLDEAVGNIYSTLTAYFAVNTCVDQFYVDYAAKNDGKQPHITTVVKDRQEHGRKLTAEQVAKAVNSMQDFAYWVETVLFGAYDEEAIALMVFPQSFGLPNYRHHIMEREELFNDGFSIYAFGYLVGCLDYTVPIGEVPFFSEVTKKAEQLPVSVSLVARPGNDIPLFDILKSLEKNGELLPVNVGRTMYA